MITGEKKLIGYILVNVIYQNAVFYPEFYLSYYL